MIMSLSLLCCHNLYLHFPTREFTFRNPIKQVALCTFTIITYKLSSLLITEILYSLFRNKMKFNPYTFIVRIQHTKGMTSKTMHVSHRPRNTPIAHYNSHLMQGLRYGCPEISIIIRTSQVCLRIALYRMIQIRKS